MGAGEVSCVKKWSAIHTFGDTKIHLSEYEASMDSKGNVLTIWTDDYQLFGSVRKPHSTSPSTFKIKGNILKRFNWPKVKSDDSGNSIILWEETDMLSGKAKLCVTYYTPAGGWSDKIDTLCDSIETWSTRLAMSPNGNAVAMYSLYTPGSFDEHYYVRIYTPGIGWSEEMQANDGWITYGDAVIDDDGNITIAWEGAGEIYMRQYTPAGGWQETVEFSSPGQLNLYAMDIAISRRGDVLLAWVGTETPNDKWLFAASVKYTKGGIWGDVRTHYRVNSTLTEPDNPRHIYGPSVALNSKGVSVVTWYANTNQDENMMFYTKGDKAGSWTEPEVYAKAVPNSTPFLSKPAVSINDKGDEMIAWMSGTSDTTTDVYARLYSATKGWGPINKLNTDPALQNWDRPVPGVMNESGQAAVCWMAKDSSGTYKMALRNWE